MAKAQATSTSPNPSTPKLATREGLTRYTGDVVGFHDCEEQGELYGIPRAAKASDSQLDSKKPSMFVIFELLEDCKATEGSGDDAVEITARKGEMVGLWLKGGMRQIKNLGGLPVLVQHTGEKKLKGKPAAFNPMKTFQFDIGKGKGTEIPVIEDNRKDSRDEDLPCGFGAGADPSKQNLEDNPGF
jgi:hypothetical protein